MIPLGLVLFAARQTEKLSLLDLSYRFEIGNSYLYEVEEYKRTIEIDYNTSSNIKLLDTLTNFFDEISYNPSLNPELKKVIDICSNKDYLVTIVDYEKYYRSVMNSISPAFLTIKPPSKDGYDFASYGRFFNFFINTVLKHHKKEEGEDIYIKKGTYSFFIKLAFEKAWGKYKTKRKTTARLYDDIIFSSDDTGKSNNYLGKISGKVDVARRSLMTQNMYNFAYLLLYLYHRRIMILPTINYINNFKGHRDRWKELILTYGREFVFQEEEISNDLPEGDIIEISVNNYIYTVTFQSILYDPDIFYIVKKRDI